MNGDDVAVATYDHRVRQLFKARRWARAWKQMAYKLHEALRVMVSLNDHLYSANRLHKRKLARLQDRIAELEEALQNLVDKLDAVAPEIEKVTMMAWIHGNRYTGPNYAEELEKGRKVLEKS